MNATTKKRLARLAWPALAARLTAADRRWDNAAMEPDWGGWATQEIKNYMAGCHKLPDGPLTPAERAAVEKAIAMRPAGE